MKLDAAFAQSEHLGAVDGQLLGADVSVKHDGGFAQEGSLLRPHLDTTGGECDMIRRDSTTFGRI